MLPTTTRKRLSHLRAQIRRQASKAARSRLEKRSSVSGVGGSNNDSVSGDKGCTFGMSFDAATSKQQQLLLLQQQQQQAGEGYSHPTNQNQLHQQQHHTPQTHQLQPHHQQHHHNQSHHNQSSHHKELHNQPNSSSSTESPNAHLSNQSTSSPATIGFGGGTSVTNNNNPDIQISANLSPTSLHNESGPSGATNVAGGGPSGAKLIGQHSVSGSTSTSGTHSNSHPFHQKNFKQKIIALLKKFRTDGSDFDSEEQYREALERELMKAAAGRGSRAIEELLEEEIDVEEESGSDLEDWDDISESSTPKPSLKPFFSSTTLDKI